MRTVLFRHPGRRDHARVRADLGELRGQLPPGVAAVVHHDAPEREDGEDLREWRERVAAHYLARRLAALRDAHDPAGGGW